MTDTLPQTSPDITPQNLTVHTGSTELPALLWTPAATPSPALVMLPDYFGHDEALRAAGARLCALGYAVLSPDLTHGTNVPAPGASLADFEDWALKQSNPASINRSLAALDALRATGVADETRLGLLGWGWGGALALMTACHDAPVRAVCDIGGAITYPVLTANRPGSPLNFLGDLEAVLYAAFPGTDVVPEDEVRRLRARVIEHDLTGEVKIYDGAPDRFWHDESLSQTRALWRRLENFLAENLALTQEGQEPLGDYPNEDSRLQA